MCRSVVASCQLRNANARGSSASFFVRTASAFAGGGGNAVTLFSLGYKKAALFRVVLPLCIYSTYFQHRRRQFGHRTLK